MAPTRVNLGLVQSLRFDLSVFFIGSTSSERGYSDLLGFQVTYLSTSNWEKRVLLLLFLKLAHALSQSVGRFPP